MRPESWPEALTPYHLTVGQARYRTDRRQGGKSQGNAPTVLALQEPEKRVGDPAGRSQASLLLQAMENQCVSMRCSIMSKRSEANADKWSWSAWPCGRLGGRYG